MWSKLHQKSSWKNMMCKSSKNMIYTNYKVVFHFIDNNDDFFVWFCRTWKLKDLCYAQTIPTTEISVIDQVSSQSLLFWLDYYYLSSAICGAAAFWPFNNRPNSKRPTAVGPPRKLDGAANFMVPSLLQILDKLFPCAIITPMDCFWEGSKLLGPDLVHIP